MNDNNNDNNNINTNDEVINNNNNINEIKENINENIMEINEDDKFGKCQISEMTAISNTDGVIVKLSDPQKIEGRIFSKSFIQYTVLTEPLGYKTDKRYSDFSWLSNIVFNLFKLCITSFVQETFGT
jgi:hypothetical protein